jgi:hypothetical protein
VEPDGERYYGDDGGLEPGTEKVFWMNGLSLRHQTRGQRATMLTQALTVERLDKKY